MYKKSIKDNSNFLFPFVQGFKYYGNDDIEMSVGTMMMLNDNGDILTCKHIAEQFIINDHLDKKFFHLLNKLSSIKDGEERKKFELENKLYDDTIVLSNINFPFKVKDNFEIKIDLHESLDLALIHIDGLDIKCDNYPVFSSKLAEPGQSICKIGYAFPEVDLFKYDIEKHSIVLKENGSANFPIFPLDGIVTRHMNIDGNISMIETSTPGLRGQSGGPIFGPDGIIYGIQSMTGHMDLNFDININVKRGYNVKNVSYTPFLNLGIGVASTEIIKFLENKNVNFGKK